MARFQPKRILPGFTPEQSASLFAMFEAQSQDVRKLSAVDTSPAIRIERVELRAKQFARLSPPARGQTAILPHPLTTAPGDTVTLSIEAPIGVLTVAVAPARDDTGRIVKGTINGQPRVTFSEEGEARFLSNGADRWLFSAEVPAEVDNSPAARALTTATTALDASYLVQTAHAALPNSRAGVTSTEIAPDYGTPGLVSWALNAASVAFSRLHNLTELSVLGRAANSAGVMAAITAGTQGHHLMRVNDALAWGDPAGDGLTLATTGVINVGGSTSITVNANDIQRPALTGAITAATNDNATLFGATASGAGLTGGGTAVLAVGAGSRITVNANDVAWTGFDLNVNGSVGSTAWIGIDIIDTATVAWTPSVPGGAFLGLALNVVDGSIGPSKLTVKVPIPEGIVLAAGQLLELKCEGSQVARVCTAYIDVDLTTGAITYGADDNTFTSSTTMVSAPASGSVRVVQSISIYQAQEDLAEICAVNFDDGAGTERYLFGPMTLADAQRVEFSVGNGWKVQSGTGAEL